MSLTPFEKKRIESDIKNLEIDIACASQELQFSQHKTQIRNYIEEKEIKIQALKLSLSKN
jgi:hypothetical protein